MTDGAQRQSIDFDRPIEPHEFGKISPPNTFSLPSAECGSSQHSCEFYERGRGAFVRHKSGRDRDLLNTAPTPLSATIVLTNLPFSLSVARTFTSATKTIGAPPPSGHQLRGGRRSWVWHRYNLWGR
jgi:hypothetical protein